MRYSLEDIVYKRIDDMAPCIYSIFLRTTLLYIGQTKKSLFRRIYSHLGEGSDSRSRIGEWIYQDTGIIEARGAFKELRYIVPHSELLRYWWIEAIDVSGLDIDRCEQEAI